MKKFVFIISVFIFSSLQIIAKNNPDTVKNIPDTVSVGIYVTSVHDVDFRQKEYSMNLWLWLKYKRPEFDFTKYLEVPMSKDFEMSYTTIDTLDDGRIYILMKLQCVMKGTWKITDFPFDRQRLRFSIENSMYGANELVFIADTAGKHYGKYFLMAWEKDSFNIETDIKEYHTSFGDPSLSEPYAEYSAFRVTMVVHRASWELFFKLFLGMYIAFLISTICFYIHPDNMDSRLELGVGSLFAVIGNKYIIDSTLPESTSFTLVDTLHGITLFYIVMVIASSVFTLSLIKQGKLLKAKRINKVDAWVMLIIYVLLNIYFINNAFNSEAYD